MAELVAGAFLSSFFQVTIERLASTDFKGLFRKGLFEKLEITLNSINQVLDEAEKKQYQNPNVKKWLNDLKHEVYEADQLFDEIATSSARQKGNKVKGFLSAYKNQFESRMKELVEKLEFLAKQRGVLGLKQITYSISHQSDITWKSSNRLPTSSLVDESSIYGRDGDKDEIINFLLSDNDILNGNQVPILSIVGLGGMGKTTLAQLVYNDHMIKKQFELKAWVYVSESFDVIRLTKAMLESFKFPADGDSLDMLQTRLQESLKGKKYLLVLDDVWNSNGECLEQLLRPFNPASSGGKIIVTTRDKGVASVMKSTRQHHLENLEKSECWSIFVKHAFHGKIVSQYPSLESIGNKIVGKCGGLPLAVKILGNLLRRKFSVPEWVEILDTDMWRLLEGDGSINMVLGLSYHNLPSSLKRCFAYCAIFPRGYMFKRGELIQLWMAEGLLTCCGTGKREEELGNEFFDDLESISFFQQSKSGNNFFVMHDLVNDLAKSVSGEFFLRIEDDRDIPKRTRHIQCCIDLEDDKQILNQVYKIEGLRSLILLAKGNIRNSVQHDLFSRLKYLRMLSFCTCYLVELSDKISNLKLLRYLDLSHTMIKRLPDSICTLDNLQTLVLRYCELTELPSDFDKLVNLRHLYILGTKIKMSKQILSLNHLQRLELPFVVGETSGFDIKELAKLNHLHGTLSIMGLENVTDPADAAAANLEDKKYLEELRMVYNRMNRSYDVDSDCGETDANDGGETNATVTEREVSVLEALQPNSNLSKLTIEHYGGSSFPIWLGDCHLSNLANLHLRRCKFCSMLPSLGQIPSLKELHIQDCNGIEIIGEEFYGNNSLNVAFRSLENLKFHDMSEWKEWFCYEGCFPLLKELSITYCPKLKMALPQQLPSLQKLEISDCGELEASIPKADNLSHLELQGCENILVNELSSSLKKVYLEKIRFPAWSSISLQQNLFNGAFLEELELDVSGFVECSSLDLHSFSTSSLQTLTIRGWRYSSLPFARLSTNLHSLKLCDCPQLELFPVGGLPSSLSMLIIANCPKLSASGEEWGFPSSLSWLEICNCPKLIASREEWGLLQLKSLKTFKVSDEFENIESFPEENLLPRTLNNLWLFNCSKLRIINYKGLLHLNSLNILSVVDCPCLERLPEEGIPDSLSTLFIHGCSSQLKQQYQKEGVERWQFNFGSKYNAIIL